MKGCFFMQNDERHIFPGGNTPQGFYSYYDNIIDKTKAHSIYCLKGGPGVGKSSYMKKVANQFQASGERIEYLHCSSDPHSLDGIHIPDYGIVMIDGTAPHVVDPVYPGAVDEIINLGSFWSLPKIRSHREEIISTQHNISYEFSRAYRYLAAAASIDDDTNTIYQSATDNDEIDKISEYIKDKIFSDKGKGTSKRTRRLFASAITPAGLVNYADTVLYDCEHVFALKIGDNLSSFSGADAVMNRIACAATERGFMCETFYCPMKPVSRIEHIVIPELKTGITVLNKYNNDETTATEVIELMQCVNRAKIRENAGKIEENNNMYAQLLLYAERALKDAYWLHNTLESFYVPNIDFDAVNENCRSVIERIKNDMENAKTF